MMKTPQIPEDWFDHLGNEFKKDYMVSLRTFLKNELGRGKIIYPHGSEIFSAFNLTPFKKVKVVVIGQDPYHGAGQAHGLSFSVKPGVRTPPSLQNIYKEIKLDLGFDIPKHGYLAPWAEQGVLLLNAILSVEKDRAASHQNRGWELFTDKVVEVLNENREDLVFFLWGAYAQKKGAAIDSKRHLVLKAPHPSPLSAHNGFLGCKHFSKANEYLQKRGISPIDWKISETL